MDSKRFGVRPTHRGQTSVQRCPCKCEKRVPLLCVDLFLVQEKRHRVSRPRPTLVSVASYYELASCRSSKTVQPTCISHAGGGAALTVTAKRGWKLIHKSVFRLGVSYLCASHTLNNAYLLIPSRLSLLIDSRRESGSDRLGRQIRVRDG